jgi:hypothetical protein
MLMVAALTDAPEFVDMPCRYGYDPHFAIACTLGCAGFAPALFAFLVRADPAQGRRASSAIHWASQSGNQEIMESVLEHFTLDDRKWALTPSSTSARSRSSMFQRYHSGTDTISRGERNAGTPYCSCSRWKQSHRTCGLQSVS